MINLLLDMISRFYRNLRNFLFIAGYLIISIHSFAQGYEYGHYPVYNFSPGVYNAYAQNWCATQDHRGLMYFGNNKGILEYDGVNWNLIPKTNGTRAQSLAVDEDGRVYFGSVGKFGYLAPDSIGNMKEVLLSDHLPDSLNVSDIWAIHEYREGIIFQSYQYLFYWKNDSLSFVYSEKEINETFVINDDLFISFSRLRLGLLSDMQIIPLSIDEKVFMNRVRGMMEVHPGKILIATEMGGFYNLTFPAGQPDQAKMEKLSTINDTFFSSIDIFNMLKLGPNKISLGTWGNGAIIIDSLFQIEAIIDKQAGLQEEVIQGQFQDRNGNLWLALSSGISRIEIQSEITDFTDQLGLEGTVEDITGFNNRVFASSNVGLYMISSDPVNPQLTNFSQAKFKAIEDFEMECWDLLSYKNDNEEILLVITNDNIFEFNENLEKDTVISLVYAYTLYQSKKDPNRVFIGLESGFSSMYRSNGNWIQEDSIEGVNELITSISEDTKGDLWLGTEEEGVIKLINSNTNVESKYIIEKYGPEHGLPDGPYIIKQINNRPVIASGAGLLRFDEQNQLFYPDSTFGPRFANTSNYIHRIYAENTSKVYMVTISDDEALSYEVGFLEQNDTVIPNWVNEPFVRISTELIQAIYEDEDKVIWLGGSHGLFRYVPEEIFNYNQDFVTYIRSVEAEEKGLLYGGAFSDENSVQSLLQHKQEKFVLPYKYNSLKFTYALQPGYNEEFNRYSYFLDGNDKNWSAWEKKSDKEYTNLREGKYTFRVKSQNIYNHISDEATYEFTILAPWYRKFWAFILYLIVAAIIVYTIVKVYTRSLREIIRERTAEVVEQKEVIEEKNNDIMDSILYAKKIQQAILPPEDDFGKLDVEGFILFLPRDIVSGDFYWLGKRNNKVITVAADCTGHGVPGAFLSMLGVTFLNNIVDAKGMDSASEILNALRDEIISALKQKGQAGEQKDGMDLALCTIDYENMKLEFAGANNPMVLIRDNELSVIKGDRMPIGIHDLADQPFKNNVMEIKKGDIIYTFSDGYQDQFGGPDNKKFMIKKLKELFIDIHKKPMKEQRDILSNKFFDWIVPYGVEQIDDVIVMGIRI